MAQAGLHALAGTAVRRWVSPKSLLPLGLVMGNMLPDADNFAVGIATLLGWPTEGLHRTFSHSVFTVLVVIAVAYLLGRWQKRPSWFNFGLGLGVGIGMHILLDLLLWFNGVYALWPLPLWVNLWQNVSPPEWWLQLMLPAEFLMFALFFAWLAVIARRQQTDTDALPMLRRWTAVEAGLFFVFLVLTFTWERFFIPYGGAYLFSLTLALVLTFRLRTTIEYFFSDK